MNIFIKNFLILVTYFFFSGCYNVSEYLGDGNLIDNGISAATDRYILDLGSVDLNRENTKTFRIMNLPDTEFVAGIKIDVSPKNRAVIEKRAIKSRVLLSLVNKQNNKIIFKNDARLDQWIWSVPSNKSKAFVYANEDSGTYFQPSPQTEYLLTLKIIQPDLKQSGYSATLIMKSSGWK